MKEQYQKKINLVQAIARRLEKEDIGDNYQEVGFAHMMKTIVPLAIQSEYNYTESQLNDWVKSQLNEKNYNEWTQIINAVDPNAFNEMFEHSLETVPLISLVPKESIDTAKHTLQKEFARIKRKAGPKFTESDQRFFAESLLNDRVHLEGLHHIGPGKFYSELDEEQKPLAYVWVDDKKVRVRDIDSLPGPTLGAMRRELKRKGILITRENLGRMFLEKFSSDRTLKPVKDPSGAVIARERIGEVIDETYTPQGIVRGQGFSQKLKKLIEQGKQRNLNPGDPRTQQNSEVIIGKLDAAAWAGFRDVFDEKQGKFARNDYVMIDGNQLKNITFPVESAFRMSAEQLKQSKSEILKDVRKQVSEKAVRKVESLLDNILRDKQQGRAPELFAQRGNKAQPQPAKFDLRDANSVAAVINEGLSRNKDNTGVNLGPWKTVLLKMANESSRIKWGVRDEQIPQGVMGLTRRQAEIIAKESGLNYSVDDILTDPRKNIAGATWLLVNYYLLFYRDVTDNPMGFALMHYLVGDKLMSEAQKKVEGSAKGTKLKLDLVIETAPENYKRLIKNFFPEKREQS